MSFIEKWTDTAISAGQSLSAKAKGLTGGVRLQYSLREKEMQRRDLLVPLGEKYLEEHRGDVDADFAVIDALDAEIAVLKARLAETRSTSSCPSCGALMPKDALFCPRCGMRQSDIFEDEGEFEE